MRHEKIFQRDDGSSVTLVSIANRNILTNKLEIDTFAVLKCDDKPNEHYYPEISADKSLHGLSVDEYIKRGRKGIMKVLRPHELLKASIKLRTMVDGCTKCTITTG